MYTLKSEIKIAYSPLFYSSSTVKDLKKTNSDGVKAKYNYIFWKSLLLTFRLVYIPLYVPY